jgi:hypothetical protein
MEDVIVFEVEYEKRYPGTRFLVFAVCNEDIIPLTYTVPAPFPLYIKTLIVFFDVVEAYAFAVT